MRSITSDISGLNPTGWTREETRPNEAKIVKGHEPYTIGAGQRACLLVHGIAGSPAQMRKLAEALVMSGLAARGTLLPGHGTHPHDLRKIVWQDWYEHIHEEYSELKREHEEVSLVGFSIGAALSAYYAAHNPVDRLVLLNVPLYPLNGRFPTGLMLKIYGAIFKEAKGRPARLIDADGEPFNFVYDRVPTSILRTMSELVGITRKSLGRINSPALIIQSKNDNVSGGKSGPFAYRRVCSREKSLAMLDSSDHSIMVGAEKDVVFGKIVDFLNGEASK